MKINACVILTMALLAITTGCQSSRYAYRRGYPWNDRDTLSLMERVRRLEALVRYQEHEIKDLEKNLSGKPAPAKKTSVNELRQQEIDDNKNAVTEELNDLALRAYKYYLTPTTRGGGGHSYTGFMIPALLFQTDNAAYTVETAKPNQIQIRATSLINVKWIARISCDENGFMGITYNGFDSY